jgi:AbrB family looped-hinge helix DNA binding protein
VSTTATIDKAGRLVLPKQVRDELGLEPGDKLDVNTASGHVTLTPIRSRASLRKEHGIWVFRRGASLPAAATDQVLGDLREGRGRRE